jgi:hypothetical protein
VDAISIDFLSGKRRRACRLRSSAQFPAGALVGAEQQALLSSGIRRRSCRDQRSLSRRQATLGDLARRIRQLRKLIGGLHITRCSGGGVADDAGQPHLRRWGPRRVPPLCFDSTTLHHQTGGGCGPLEPDHFTEDSYRVDAGQIRSVADLEDQLDETHPHRLELLQKHTRLLAAGIETEEGAGIRRRRALTTFSHGGVTAMGAIRLVQRSQQD